MLSRTSASAIRRLFLSSTFLHILVAWRLPLSARHGTSMLHRDNLGCGRFPSSKMITISRTFRLQKCIHIAVRVPALPGQLSTGHIHGPPLVGKTRRYVCGLPPVAKAYQIQRSSFACPCCANRWDASDPDAISFPHSLHSTRYFCRSRYVAPPCHLPSVRSYWD